MKTKWLRNAACFSHSSLGAELLGLNWITGWWAEAGWPTILWDMFTWQNLVLQYQHHSLEHQGQIPEEKAFYLWTPSDSCNQHKGHKWLLVTAQWIRQLRLCQMLSEWAHIETSRILSERQKIVAASSAHYHIPLSCLTYVVREMTYYDVWEIKPNPNTTKEELKKTTSQMLSLIPRELCNKGGKQVI